MNEQEQTPVRVVNKRVLDEEGAAGHGAPDGAAPVPAAVDEAGAPDELAQARELAAQYLDDLQRLKAEFENYRKRTTRDQDAIADRIAAALVERLLPVLDNFELALMAADRTKDYESMVRGVEMVYGELRDVLGKAGLERIDSLHQPFDPAKHEAVMHEQDDDGDGEHVVTDEMRSGYSFAGRVLRPAMVKVGKRKS